MKLHLPKSLRSALLACLAAVAPIATTVATSSMIAGTFALTVAPNTASAIDYYVNDCITTVSDSNSNPFYTAATEEGNGAAVAWTTALGSNSVLVFATDAQYLIAVGVDKTGNDVMDYNIDSGSTSIGGITVLTGAEGYSYGGKSSVWSRASTLFAADGSDSAEFNIYEDFLYYNACSDSISGYNSLYLTVDANINLYDDAVFTMQNWVLSVSGDVDATVNITGKGTFAYTFTMSSTLTQLAYGLTQNDWVVGTGATFDLSSNAAAYLTSILGTGSVTLNGGTLKLMDSATLMNTLVLSSNGGAIDAANITLSNTIVCDASYSSDYAIDMKGAAVSLTSALTLSFESDLADGTYTLLTNVGSIEGADLDLAVEGAAVGTSVTWLFEDNTLSFVYTSSDVEFLTWSSGETLNLTEGTTGFVDGDTFANGDAITISSTNADIVVTGDVTVPYLTVDDNLTVSLTVGESELSLTAVALGDGSTLTIKDDALSSSTSFKDSASTSIVNIDADGASLSYGEALSSFTGTLKVTSADLDLSNSTNSLSLSSLSIGAGSSVELGAASLACTVTMTGSDDAAVSTTLSTSGSSISALNAMGGTITLDIASSTTLSGVAGSGTLVKTGTGTLTLAGASYHSGTLQISDGTFAFGNNQESTDEIGFSTLILESGTTLYVEHGSTATAFDLVLNGGTVSNYDGDAVGRILLGTVTVNAASTVSHIWGVNYDIAKLTGSDTLSFTTWGYEASTINVQAIEDYDGTIAAGSSTTSLIIGSVSAAQGVSTVITGSSVSSSSLSMTGAGSLSIETLNLTGGTLDMSVEGTASITSLNVTGSSTLVYDLAVANLFEITTVNLSSGVSLTIDTTDITEEQLAEGFSLGLSTKALTDSSVLLLDGYESYEYVITDADGTWYVALAGMDMSEIVWEGGDGNWSDADEWLKGDDAATFVEGNKVTIGTAADTTGGTITISSDVKPTSLAFAGAADWTISATDDASLSLYDGITMNGTGIVNITAAIAEAVSITVNSGSLTVADVALLDSLAVTGGALTVAGDLVSGVDIDVSGGSLTIESTSSIGDLTVTGGYVDINSDIDVSGALTVSGGETNIESANQLWYLTASGDASLTVGGIDEAYLLNVSDTASVTITDALTGYPDSSGALLSIEVEDAATLDLQGGSEYISSLSVTGGTATIGAYEGDGGVTTIASLSNSGGGKVIFEGDTILTSLSVGTTNIELADGVTVTANGGAITTASSNERTQAGSSYTVSIVVGDGALYSDNVRWWTKGGTFDVTGGGTVQLSALLLDCTSSQTTMTVGAGTTLEILSTGSSTTTNLGFGVSGATGGYSTSNIEGTLIINGSIYSYATGTSPVVNVLSTGTMQMNDGIFAVSNSTSVLILMNVEGTLCVGDQASATDYSSEITVTMNDGATLIDNGEAETSTVYTSLSYAEGATVNFASTENGELVMASAVSANVNVSGTVGFSTLTLTDSLVNSGTMTLSGALTATGTAVTVSNSGTISIGVDGSITVAAEQSMNLNGTIALTDAGQILNYGTLSIDSGISFDLSELAADAWTTDDDGTMSLVLVGGEGADLSALTVNNLTGVDTATWENISFNDDGTISYMESATDLVWGGGSGDWTTADEWLNGDAADTFANGDSVTIGTSSEEAGNYAITLGRDISLGSLAFVGAASYSIEATGYTIDVTGGVTAEGTGTTVITGNVTAASVKVGDAATETNFTIDGNLESIGPVAAAANSHVTITGDVTMTGDATTSGNVTSSYDGSTMTIGGNLNGSSTILDTLGTITIEGLATGINYAIAWNEGTSINFNGGIDSSSAILYFSGGTISIGASSSVGSLAVNEDDATSLLEIADGVTVTVNGGNDSSTSVYNRWSNVGYTISLGVDSVLDDNASLRMYDSPVNIIGSGTYKVDNVIVAASSSAAYITDEIVLTVGAGATMIVVGTETSTTATSSFILGGAQNTMSVADVYGTLELNSGIGVCTAGATSSTLNVYKGGTLTMHAGLIAESSGGAVNMNLYTGATLALGTASLTENDYSAGDLNVNLYDGTTITTDGTTDVTVYTTIKLVDDATVNVLANAGETINLYGGVVSAADSTIAITSGGTLGFASAGYTSNNDWEVTGSTIDFSSNADDTTLAAAMGTGTLCLNSATAVFASGATVTSAIAVETNSSISVAGGGTITLNGLYIYDGSSVASLDLSDASVTLGDDYSLSIVGGIDGGDYIILTGALDITTDMLADIDITGLSDNQVVTWIYDDGTLTLSIEGNGLQTIVWEGGSGNWNDADEWLKDGSAASFADGDYVTIGTDADSAETSSTITLDADVKVTDLTFVGDATWTLTPAADETLTVTGDITKMDAGIVTIATTVLSADSIFVGGGSLGMNVDADSSIGSIDVAAGTLLINASSVEGVDEDGNPTISGASIGSMTVSGGELTVNGYAEYTSGLTLTGGTVNLGEDVYLKDTAVVSGGALNIDSLYYAALTLKGGTTTIDDAYAVYYLYVSGEAEATIGGLEIAYIMTVSDTASLTFTDTVYSASGTSLDVDVSGGTLDMQAGADYISSMTVSGGSATIGDYVDGDTTIASLTIRGGASVTLSGDTTITSLGSMNDNTTEETLVVNNGATVTIANEFYTGNTSFEVGVGSTLNLSSRLCTGGGYTNFEGGGTVNLNQLLISGSTTASGISAASVLSITGGTTVNVSSTSAPTYLGYVSNANFAGQIVIGAEGDAVTSTLNLANYISLCNTAAAGTITVNSTGQLGLDKGFTVVLNSTSAMAGVMDVYGTVVVGNQADETDYSTNMSITLYNGASISDNGVDETTTVYTSLTYADNASVNFSSSADGELVMATAVTANANVSGTVGFSTLTLTDTLTNSGSLTLNGALTGTQEYVTINNTGTISISSTGSITVAESQYMSLNGTIALSDAGQIVNNNGTLTLAEDIVFDLSAIDESAWSYDEGSGTYSLVLISGTAVDLTSLSIIDNLEGADSSWDNLRFGDDGTLLYGYLALETLVWDGGNNGTWSDGCGGWADSSATFDAGENVIFNADSTVLNVTVDAEGVSVAELTVTGATYYIGDIEQGSISISKSLTIGDSTTAQIDSALIFGESASITIGEGAVLLNFNDNAITVAAFDSLGSMESFGWLTVNSDVTNGGILTVENLTVNGDADFDYVSANDSLTVTGDATIDELDSTKVAVTVSVTGALIIGDGSDVKGTVSAASLTSSGTVSIGTLDTSSVTNTGDLTVTGSTTITLSGDLNNTGTLDLGTNSLTLEASTYSGGYVTVGDFNLTNSQTMAMFTQLNASGTVTAAADTFVYVGSYGAVIDSSFGAWAGDGGLSNNGSGTISIDSDTTIVGTYSSYAGTLDLGTHSLTLETSTTMGGTLIAGDVTLAGGDMFTSITASGALTTGGTLTVTSGLSVGSSTMSLGGTLSVTGDLSATNSLTSLDVAVNYDLDGSAIITAASIDASITSIDLSFSDDLASLTSLGLKDGNTYLLLDLDSAYTGSLSVDGTSADDYSLELSNGAIVTIGFDTEGNAVIFYALDAIIIDDGVWDSSTDTTGETVSLVSDLTVDGDQNADALEVSGTTVTLSTDGESESATVTIDTAVNLDNANLTVSVDELNASTAAVNLDNSSTLTLAEGSTMEAASMDVDESSTFSNEGESNITALSSTGSVTNSGTLTLGDGSNVAGLVNDGDLTLNNGASVTTLSGTGLTTLNTGAISITDAGTALFVADNAEVNYSGDMSLDSVVLGDAATMSVASADALTVESLSGTGTLVATGDLTITNVLSGSSVSVQAATVTLDNAVTLSSLTGDKLITNGADISTVTVNSIELTSLSYVANPYNVVTYKLGASDATYVLTLDTLADYDDDDDTITLSLTGLKETVADGTYYLIEGASWSDFALDTETSDMISTLVNDYNKDVIKSSEDGNLILIIAESDNRTWSTSNNYVTSDLCTTEDTACIIPVYDEATRALVGLDVLDTVEQVNVDADLNINFGDMAGDSVSLNNLKGVDGATLTVEGNGDVDLVLYNDRTTVANNALTIDSLNMSVSNDAGTGDLTLAELNATAGSVVQVLDQAIFTVGDLNLDATSTLVVNEGGSLTVADLMTEEGSTIAGALSLSSGTSTLASGYEDATITLINDASATLASGAGGLTVAGSSGTLYASSDYVLPVLNTTGATVNLGTVTADSSYALSDASSMTGGSLVLSINSEAIGSDEAMTVSFDGAELSLTGVNVVINQSDNATSFTGLTNNETYTLLSLDGVTLDETSTFTVTGDAFSKYLTDVSYDSTTGNISATYFIAFYDEMAMTENGAAGLNMANAALLALNPEQNDKTPDLGSVIASMDDYYLEGNYAAADKLGAALAGSTTTSLGSALMSDVERQLRSIRNRTKEMGIGAAVANEESTGISAWITADAGNSQLDSSGTHAGHSLNSVGGSIGLDFDVAKDISVGVAFSALYGDLSSTGADTAEGNLDTMYGSLYARIKDDKWNHSFVATFGLVDAKLNRTVATSSGYYKTSGKTDGSAMGLMYELTYDIALNEDASTVFKPVFNAALVRSNIDGYTERNSDAALIVGDQKNTYATFGLGGAIHSLVGEGAFNRSSVLGARALLKVDAGDRTSEADVSLVNNAGYTETVKGAEVGSIGVELGIGLSVPVTEHEGSLFADFSCEFRSGMTNVSGTVGYRFTF